MAKISPYTQTRPYQYKSLGLEAFAQPLARMQTNINTARKTIEDTQFDVSHLATDQTRAKELTSDFESTRDELLSNLMKTNNYTQAASKIKELNKFFTKNDEIGSIASNRASFDKSKAAMEERVKGGDNTEQDYQEWLFYTLGKFDEKGGTNYNPELGTSNSINTELRTKNLEKEITDLAIKLANSAPAQVDTILSEWAGSNIDPAQLQSLKTTLKAKLLLPGSIGKIEHQGIASELHAVLANSKRYKDFVNQEAKYKYYWDKNHAKDATEFDYKILEGTNKEFIETEQNLINAIASESDLTKKKQLSENLEKIRGERKVLNDIINTGDVASLAESIHSSDYYNNYIGRTATDVGNVYDFVENQQVRQTAEIPGAKDAIKKLEELPKINTAQQQVKGGQEYLIDTDYGVSSIDQRDVFKGKSMGNWFSTTFTDVNAIFDEDLSLVNNIKKNKGVSANKVEKELEAIKYTTNAWNGLEQEYTRMANKELAVKNELSEIEKEYLSLSDSDKLSRKGKEVISRYNETKQDLEEIITSPKTEELYYIENKFKEYAGVNKEFADLFYKNFNGDVQATLKNLVETNKEKGERFALDIESLTKDKELEAEAPGGQDMIYPGINYDPETGESTGEKVLMWNFDKYGDPSRYTSESAQSTYMDGKNIATMYHEAFGKAKKYLKESGIYSQEEINDMNWHTYTKASPQDLKDRFDFGTNIYEDYFATTQLEPQFKELVDEIQTDLTSKKAVAATEMIITEDAKKWIPEIEEVTKFVLENPPESATGIEFYDFDGASRTAKENSKIKTTIEDPVAGFAMELYKDQDFSWEGVADIQSQQGDREGQVLRMKRAGDKTKILKLLQSRYEVENAGEKWDDLTPSVRTSIYDRFLENNPTDVHTAVIGTSFDLNSQSVKNYKEYLDAAALAGDVAAANYATENTAVIDLLSDTKTISKYQKLTGKLLNAVQNKTSEKITHNPNYWDIDETNNTIKGNIITYFYDKDMGNIIMEVTQNTYKLLENGMMGDLEKINKLPQTIMNGFDAITLRANDIKFGTGGEDEILYYNNKQIIPPAFRMGEGIYNK